MSRWAVVVAAVAVLGSVGCGPDEPIRVSGVTLDVERFVFARMGRLAERMGAGGATPCAGGPCGGAEALEAATVAGAAISVIERPQIPEAVSDAAGRWTLPAVPSRERLHLRASSPGAACAAADGLGLQFPESDVASYPLGLFPADGFLAAIAAEEGAPAADLGLVVFLVMDAAPFPDSEILDDQIAVRLSGGSGKVVFGGWDPAARRFVLAPAADGFAAPTLFVGLVGLVHVEDGTIVEVTDHAAPSGRRPAFFLRYTARPQAGACVVYLLRALG